MTVLVCARDLRYTRHILPFTDCCVQNAHVPSVPRVADSKEKIQKMFVEVRVAKMFFIMHARLSGSSINISWITPWGPPTLVYMIQMESSGAFIITLIMMVIHILW